MPLFRFDRSDVAQQLIALSRNNPTSQVDLVDVLRRVTSPCVAQAQFSLIKMAAKLGDGHRSRFRSGSHLAYLKNAGLVLDRRAYYRLVRTEDAEIIELVRYLAQAFASDKGLKADMKKLREAIKNGSCTVSEWKPMSGLAPIKSQFEGV